MREDIQSFIITACQDSSTEGVILNDNAKARLEQFI